MIQIAGITFLSEYDHMMREQTEAEDYGRSFIIQKVVISILKLQWFHILRNI